MPDKKRLDGHLYEHAFFCGGDKEIANKRVDQLTKQGYRAVALRSWNKRNKKVYDVYKYKPTK